MSATASKSVPPVDARDHVRGADRADLTVIEYGDFGCPFCFAAQRPLDSQLRRYDRMRLVWRHLPDPELHPGADLAAELSELAATEGKFWEAHSLLLAGGESFSTEGLMTVGQGLGLEKDAVRTALHDRTFRPRVEEDVAGGRRGGARGTPTFFLNGERLEGPWRNLATAVPSALEASR